MSNKFNVGDKVERVSGYDYSSCGIVLGGVYTIIAIDCAGDFQFDGIENKWWLQEHFELVQPKQFTKTDLKDGMRVVYRCGDKRLVVGTDLYKPTSDYIWVVNLAVYDDNLVWKSNDSCTIVEVYERDGTLLWKREEAPVKTQTQIEYEELQKTIKELQAKAENLGKLL